MKRWMLVFMGLIGFAAVAAAPTKTLVLITLKPTHKKVSKPLGQISAELKSATSGFMISTASGFFGDCTKCVRGFAVKDHFGVRLEGAKIDAVKPVWKVTPKKATVRDCKNGANVGQTECHVEIGDQAYVLSLIL